MEYMNVTLMSPLMTPPVKTAIVAVKAARVGPIVALLAPTSMVATPVRSDAVAKSAAGAIGSVIVPELVGPPPLVIPAIVAVTCTMFPMRMYFPYVEDGPAVNPTRVVQVGVKVPSVTVFVTSSLLPFSASAALDDSELRIPPGGMLKRVRPLVAKFRPVNGPPKIVIIGGETEVSILKLPVPFAMIGPPRKISATPPAGHLARSCVLDDVIVIGAVKLFGLLLAFIEPVTVRFVTVRFVSDAALMFSGYGFGTRRSATDIVL